MAVVLASAVSLVVEPAIPTANNLALGPVVETLLCGCHLPDASKTILVGEDGSLCVSKVSISPGFAMLVIRVVGMCHLPVKWHVEHLSSGCSYVEAHTALEGS